MDKLEIVRANLLMRCKIVIKSTEQYCINDRIMAIQSPYLNDGQTLLTLADKIRTYAESNISFSCKLTAELEAHYGKRWLSLASNRKSLYYLIT